MYVRFEYTEKAMIRYQTDAVLIEAFVNDAPIIGDRVNVWPIMEQELPGSDRHLLDDLVERIGEHGELVVVKRDVFYQYKGQPIPQTGIVITVEHEDKL